MNGPHSSTALNQEAAIGDLVQREQVASIPDYIAKLTKIYNRWQDENLSLRKADASHVLNNARLVGQVWYRGQRNCIPSLRPGLYRDYTIKSLRKALDTSTEPGGSDKLFKELFDLEHESRIDFVSYGHLLNPVNHARSDIDWYFLMQHHGVPTRLLDWTTNSLAALFFAVDACLQGPIAPKPPLKVAVWMLDAYWLADRLSEDWSAPLLPWSDDARRYVPPLEHVLDQIAVCRARIPAEPMPIEPPAMHPRVAAQEGRFLLFGKTQDLMEERLRLRTHCARELGTGGECAREEARIFQLEFSIESTEHFDSLLAELAQTGVSRRTLYPDLSGLADFVRWKHLKKLGGYNLEFGRR